MSKAFIELKYRKKTYKLRANDISKLYKTPKRPTPKIPSFYDNFKNSVETDCDISVQEDLRGWSNPRFYLIFYSFAYL